MEITDKVIIKETNQKGKIIGRAKGLWIVELCNGLTKAYPTNKLKQIN